jgi:hypothetical protein
VCIVASVPGDKVEQIRGARRYSPTGIQSRIRFAFYPAGYQHCTETRGLDALAG